MSNKTTLYIVLIILLLLIIKQQGACVTPEKPNPPVTVIDTDDNVPVVIPKLESNFVYDDLDKAKALASFHKKKVVIVFGAEWCPYCRVLKKDSKSIKQLDKYIVCFLDTDNKKSNQSDINRYKPRNLPTSVLVDKAGKELSRKIGYRNKDYIKWLESQP
tara:strand:+ start:1333 stop:1812 length:480 start_codon:yes stop_codon:yes gene_type:complete